MSAVEATPTAMVRSISGRTTADRWRRGLATGAVIATLPYSALKVAWLSGSRIGLADPSFGTSAAMQVLNSATLGLDLVALTLAVMFGFGVRAPKWFVLPTMWVGYGLLGQLLVIIAPTVLVQMLTGPVRGSDSASPIEPWVYGAVYTGFSGLGLCLLPAFAIYAWQRWGRELDWGGRLAAVRHGRLPKLPAVITGVLVVALAARSSFADSAPEAVGPAVDAVIGLIALAAIRSAVTGRPGRLRCVVPLAAIWTASGAWTAWGAYYLVLGTLPNDLVTDPVASVDIVLAGGRVLAGASLLLIVGRLASTDHEA